MQDNPILYEEDVYKENDNFMLEQKKWAIDWFNENICRLMEDRVIIKISVKEKSKYKIFVGEKWYELSLYERIQIIKDTNKALIILEKNKAVEIWDNKTEILISEIKNGEVKWMFGE
ncbi:MAG: hypothetical protein SV062_07675 [Thermodesulfobacteriota bacterium]|nr:hypothetical protein [Thermodesulfobacteriota bacterium]